MAPALSVYPHPTTATSLHLAQTFSENFTAAVDRAIKPAPQPTPSTTPTQPCNGALTPSPATSTASGLLLALSATNFVTRPMAPLPAVRSLFRIPALRN